MVLTNKYSELLIKKFPYFAKSNSLKEAIELFEDDDTADEKTLFIGLTNYVVDELIFKNENITQEEVEIYKFIEEIRIKYSKYMDNTEERLFDEAACTCFLENLQNTASSGRIKYSRFIPYLGEKSKEFCKAWDEFTGVKSEGLWEKDNS